MKFDCRYRAENQRLADRRRPGGNILILSCMLGGILVCSAIFCLSISAASVISSNLQGRVDAMALEAATSLNKDDVVGQLNNLIARCRILVEDSRQSYDLSAVGGRKRLQPLAEYLLDQSRDGASFLESERKHLAILKTSNIAETIEDQVNNGAIGSVLPWVAIKQVSIKAVRVGTMGDLSSNVLANKNELYDFDLRQHYIARSSNFYRGNLNARLPNCDRDLPFNIASLPAPGENIVAPARLFAANRFVPTTTICADNVTKLENVDQIPAAVQIEFACRAIDQLTGHEYMIPLSATACTHGAQPTR